MAIVSKTIAQAVAAWENGQIEVAFFAVSDATGTFILAVRTANGTREVWSVT